MKIENSFLKTDKINLNYKSWICGYFILALVGGLMPWGIVGPLLEMQGIYSVVGVYAPTIYDFPKKCADPIYAAGFLAWISTIGLLFQLASLFIRMPLSVVVTQVKVSYFEFIFVLLIALVLFYLEYYVLSSWGGAARNKRDVFWKIYNSKVYMVFYYMVVWLFFANIPFLIKVYLYRIKSGMNKE